MIENRSFTLLKSLSKEEFRWLYKFIKSPYYNVNGNLIKLYELLRKYYPDFNQFKLSSELLFSKLFPKETYDIQKMQFLFHHFANLVESFLVAQELKTDPFLYKKTLTKSLGRINTYDLFEKKTNELLNELEASPFRDEFYFKNKEEINIQFYSHPATNRHKIGEGNLANAIKSLDDYFELSKVKQACGLKSRQRTLSTKGFELKYLDFVLQKTSNSNLLIRMYSKILILQESDEALEVFENLKTLFESKLDEIREEDRRSILQLLLNFCTRIANKGNKIFSKYTLTLYKLGLENDCLIINNEFSDTAFTNIVSCGIINKDYDWTESFIVEYGKYLDDKIKEDAFTYSWAILFFYQREFDKTTDLLLNYNFVKPLKNILAKTVLIRAYVEKTLIADSYYDLSNSQLSSFEKYIRNNKTVPEKARRGYLNFIQYTRKFLNIRGNKIDEEKLKAKILKTKELALKNWLLEMLTT